MLLCALLLGHNLFIVLLVIIEHNGSASYATFLKAQLTVYMQFVYMEVLISPSSA